MNCGNFQKYVSQSFQWSVIAKSLIFSQNENPEKFTCYNSLVSRKRLTRRLTPPGCLTSEQERYMTLLKWWTGSNGNLFADHSAGRFCISNAPFPMGGRIYHVALNGGSKGGCGNLAGAKQMAIELAENNGKWAPRQKAKA